MELRKTQTGNCVTIEVIGTIDTETSQVLNRELLTLDYSSLDLTLDFKEAVYITSAGLRVLLVARKKLSDETMRILNVNENIAEVFEMTGFSEMLNFTRQSVVDEQCFHMSFKALLKKKLDDGVTKPAFVYAGRAYTWQDVEMASQIIASDLAALGVKKGSHVGICSLNSINWIFAFFAVQKLGGIAVLMNYSLKPNEIIALSQIGDVTHFCCGNLPGVKDYESYLADVTGSGSVVRATYDIRPTVDFTARFGEYPALEGKFAEMYHADDASVVIFSSGSTGRPKAILSSSYNLLSCMATVMKDFQFTDDDRNLAFLPLFHVFGFATCISIGLLSNDTSYIPESSRPEELLNMIDEYKCTLFHSVPTMVLAMTQHKEFSPERVASLRVSMLGGAATTAAQMTMLCKLYPNNHFGNVYGMSENAAISVTAYGDSVEHITQTVGKPVAGLEIEIRDPATGRKLTDGQAGEVCIRSENMVVCYYKLAIDRQPLDDEGWLATGDLGVLLEDGYLKLVGRAKDLIIRGGENISPGEVADAVATLPEVADVKVLGVPNDLYGEEVAAAVILKEGASLDEEAAKNTLLAKLAKFKVPAYFVVFERFPLLGSGKVDAITLKQETIKAIQARN